MTHNTDVIALCRYTAFIVLYPIGLLPGESKSMFLFFIGSINCLSSSYKVLLSNVMFIVVWLMYEALPHIKQKNLYADYFSALPFSYYNFVMVSLFPYIYA